MSDAITLSLAFLKHHPAGAARALAEVPAEEAAAFAANAPDALVAATLNRMQPADAVRVLQGCGPKTAGSLLSQMTGNAQAAVLRGLPDADRDAALATLSKRAAAGLRRLLSHAADSVGAWMEATRATFRPDVTVADCLERVRAMRTPMGGIVYLTDADGGLLASVDIDDVLAADDDATLDSLPVRKVRALNPQATLASVIGLPDWDGAWALPVVDRRRRLLGVLSFENLRHGLAAERGESAGWQFNILLLHVAQALLVSLSGLLQVAVTRPGLSRFTPHEEP